MANSQTDYSRQPANVVVAIVNYCTAKLTIDCLRSLVGEREAFPSLTVYVSDNASPDGSGAAIAKAVEDEGWSGWVHVLLNDRNGGFAYGNNQVVRAFQATGQAADFYWLLNSDTVVRGGALKALIDYLAENPKVGMAGSRLEHMDETRQVSSFRFHTIASELESSARVGLITRLLESYRVAPERGDDPEIVDWVAGASMLVRSEVFDQVGLMDEAYFLYYEETDFCRRARNAGFLTAYVPSSRVVHLVGQSTGVTSGPPKRIPAYWFESRRRYFLAHHGALYTFGADMALAVGSFLGHARDMALRRPVRLPDKFIVDLLRHSALFGPWRAQSAS